MTHLLTFLIGLYLGNNLPNAMKGDRLAYCYGMGRRKRLRHFIANLIRF